MTNKEQLMSFMYKYYLDGLINKAVIEVEDGYLRTRAFDVDNQLYCTIKMTDVDIFSEKNKNLVISDTSSLFSLLKAFDDPNISIHYNQNNMVNYSPHSLIISENNIKSNFLLSMEGVVSSHDKSLETDDTPIIEFEVSEDIYKSFTKYKGILKSETKSFSFIQKDNSTHILFGLMRGVGSNNISIDIGVQPNHHFQSQIIFPIDVFYSIIRQNEGQFIKVKVFNNFMIVDTIGNNFENRYVFASQISKV